LHWESVWCKIHVHTVTLPNPPAPTHQTSFYPYALIVDIPSSLLSPPKHTWSALIWHLKPFLCNPFNTVPNYTRVVVLGVPTLLRNLLSARFFYYYNNCCFTYTLHTGLSTCCVKNYCPLNTGTAVCTFSCNCTMSLLPTI